VALDQRFTKLTKTTYALLNKMGSSIDENTHFDRRRQVISMCERTLSKLHKVVDSVRTGQLCLSSLLVRQRLVNKYTKSEKQRVSAQEWRVMKTMVIKLQESLILLYHVKSGTSCDDTTIREIIMTVVVKPSPLVTF